MIFIQVAVLEHAVGAFACDDDVIQQEHTRMIADAIPGSRLEILQGDHDVARHNVDEYNPLVLSFLAEG